LRDAKPVKQAELAEFIGVTRQRAGQLIRAGAIPAHTSLVESVRGYCRHLREVAAGRASASGGLDLVQERAALARAQREGVEIKNATLRGQYADVALLAEVLGTASQAVAERFEHLPGWVRKACPDLPPEAIDAVMKIIATARNEWVAATAELVAAAVETTDEGKA